MTRGTQSQLCGGRGEMEAESPSGVPSHKEPFPPIQGPPPTAGPAVSNCPVLVHWSLHPSSLFSLELLIRLPGKLRRPTVSLKTIRSIMSLLCLAASGGALLLRKSEVHSHTRQSNPRAFLPCSGSLPIPGTRLPQRLALPQGLSLCSPSCLQDSLCLLCPALCPRRGLLGAAAAAWAWPIEGIRMRKQAGRLLLFCLSLPGCCVWGTAASHWPAALEGWTLFHGSSSWQAPVIPPAPSS